MNTNYAAIDFGGIFIKKDYPTKLIINDRTMILYMDGKKAVVKCQKGDKFDKEKGLLLAIAKINGISYSKLTKILDNAQIQKPESKKRSINISVGDIVRVTNPGSEYMTYYDWFDKYAKGLKERYACLEREEGENIEKTNYYVLAKGIHEWSDYGMLYAISKDKNSGKVILINGDGLQRVKKSKGNN